MTVEKSQIPIVQVFQTTLTLAIQMERDGPIQKIIFPSMHKFKAFTENFDELFDQIDEVTRQTEFENFQSEVRHTPLRFIDGAQTGRQTESCMTATDTTIHKGVEVSFHHRELFMEAFEEYFEIIQESMSLNFIAE